MAKVRTNSKIEGTPLRTSIDRQGVRTKTEAADVEDRHPAGRPMTREEALARRGAHAIDEASSTA